MLELSKPVWTLTCRLDDAFGVLFHLGSVKAISEDQSKNRIVVIWMTDYLLIEGGDSRMTK